MSVASSLTSSWVHYDQYCEFPIQNIPYGVFHKKNEHPREGRIGVAIGDQVLDLSVIAQSGLMKNVIGDPSIFCQSSLNRFMSCGRPVWVEVRRFLQELLAKENPTLRDNADLRAKALIPLDTIVNLLPAHIGDYTDFYSSKEHATNMGRIIRPDEEPLKPNWVWLPVGYHGRASSVVPSGTPVRRPNGQVKPPTAPTPTHSHCAKLDLELETAVFIGPGNKQGDPIKIESAEDHLFGMVLMNDWSARDIQAWEYVPLGPFGAKNFGTTISPWIVTFEALEPFRLEGPPQDPPVLSYLKPNKPGSYDIHLEVLIKTQKLKDPVKIANGNFKHLYWSMAQQLVHHTVTGCNMLPGDLLGSGTISGPDKLYGSLMEISANGKTPFVLPNGETRTYFEDGDTCIIHGWAQADGYRIGFGECSGEILPAHPIQK